MAIDFNSKNPPLQREFNDYHAKPIEYGEDGDQLLSFHFTRPLAVEMFTQKWIHDTGEKPDFDISKSVYMVKAGWTVDPDNDSDNAFTFVYLRGTTDVKPIYDAWALIM